MYYVQIIILCICFTLINGCESTSKETPPNIVFILIDDMGWRDLGVMGSTYYKTPRIDAMAAEGMVFSQAYANAPNCAPSRAALMSGQYAPRHGVYTVGSPMRGESRYRALVPTANTTFLDTATVTIAEALRDAGYTTAHFGKWHLGGGDYSPDNQGFDVVDQGSWGVSRSHFMPESGEYLADYLTDRAVEFMRADRDEPFFLYLSHYGVHTPIESKAEKVDKFASSKGDEYHFDATYAGMIESIDESVGRILDVLEERSLSDRTLVVFYSDNGGYGPITKMHPLRGAKGMLYEGGIRVPLIVRWPAHIRKGARSETPVLGIDWFPTLMEVAGISTISFDKLDGESLVPVFEGSETLSTRALYWHFPAYLEAYRDAEVPWRTTPASAIRLGNYKLIEYFAEQQLELYNLSEDVGELDNLVQTLPKVADSLQALMQKWRLDVQAPVPNELNPDFESEAYEAALKLHDPYRP